MVVASAPGKVMLFGEYAVLRGGLALVAAVQRRAVCTFEPGPELVVEGRGFGVRHWPPRPGDVAMPFAEALFRGLVPRSGRYVLDSAALADEVRGVKLGLGSSAASTVALLAAAANTTEPNYLYPMAFSAHREAQGSGSGADVAASAHGGIIRYRLGEDFEDPADIAPMRPGRTRLWTVWTGQPARTGDALRQLTRNPTLRATAESRIAYAAEEAEMFWSGSLVAPAAATIAALEDLGRAIGFEIVTDLHRRLDARARALGGRVKPTGAGGGDLAWIVGDGEAHEAKVAAALASEGHPVVPLEVDPLGAHLAQVAEQDTPGDGPP